MSLYANITLPGKPDLENVRRLDLLPIPQIIRMQRLGIAVDLDYLAALSSEITAEMVDLQRDIASYIPQDKLDTFASRAAAIEETDGSATINASSAEQIRVLLFEMLAVGGGKQLKQTASGKVSTGKKTLELCRDDHPVVPKVLEYRERAKLKSAFTDSLPKKARLHPRGPCCPVCELPHDAATWRVHTEFTTTRAETGRLSSKGPNLQQIPIRTSLGARIRRAFVGSPGKKLVSSDFGQIELVDLAHLADAASMKEVYWAKGDIHLFTAQRIFDIEDPAKVDKIKHRLPCKNVNFMIVYGASAKGLQAQLALSKLFWTEDECEDFISRWYGLYPEVQAYLELQHYRARRYGFIWDLWGRVRRVPETRSCHSYIRAAGLRQAGNMPIQACSAGQTKLAMAELEERLEDLYRSGVYCWPLLAIHDQVITEVEEDWADVVGQMQVEIMAGVMNDKRTGESYWRVPITADCEILDRWEKS